MILACRECLREHPDQRPYRVEVHEADTDETVLEQMRAHLVRRHAPKVAVAIIDETFGYPESSGG